MPNLNFVPYALHNGAVLPQHASTAGVKPDGVPLVRITISVTA